jgi:serine/threonine-protein phosphatase 6 regulatory ankyrin repeat subunit B
LLIREGVNVNDHENIYRISPLTLAVDTGNSRIVKLLLNQPGIDINSVNIYGDTALMYACRSGRMKIVNLIFYKMILQSQHYEPTEENEVEEEEKIMVQNQQYKQIKEEIIQNQQDKFVKEVIIKSQQYDSAKEKIKHLSAKEIKEKFFNAVNQGNINDIDMLLDAKSIEGKFLINVNARNDQNDTALIIASENGNLEAVKSLIQYKADITLKDTNGNNALIRAAKRGCFDVVEELLFRKASINSTNNYNKTALMEAAENGYIRVVKLLIKKGAKVSIKDKLDKTALDIVNAKFKSSMNIRRNYNSIKEILERKIETSKTPLELLGDEKYIANVNDWEVITDNNYLKDLKDWKKNNPNNYNKTVELVSHIKSNPFRGIGRPERLTEDMDGLYSRRISKQDRLVYEVDGEKIILKSCKGHYKKEKRK